jgi:hypothetical protein
MIADVLSEAIDAIDDEVTKFHDVYGGIWLGRILAVRAHMNALRIDLDADAAIEELK